MKLGHIHIPLLLYADDVVIIAPSFEDCQAMMDALTNWCRRWGMHVNHGKSQVVHVRNHQCPLCDRDLILDLREILYVPAYKYLWCSIHEFLNFSKTMEALTLAVGGHSGE